MKFCKIFINFMPNHFESLEQRYNLTNSKIITNDILIKHEGITRGYDIEWIDEHFGYANEKLYEIYEKAISNVKILDEVSNKTQCENISLLEGMKIDFISRLIFVEQITKLLENNNDIIFLLTSKEYEYFVIEDIASDMEFITNFFSISKDGSKISPTSFKRSMKSLEFLYGKNELNLTFDETYSIQKLAKSKIKKSFPESFRDIPHLFFLSDNSNELYLKSIFPIIDEFERNKTPYLIFSLDNEASTHLKDRGYKFRDLNRDIMEITFPILGMHFPLQIDEQYLQKVDVVIIEKEGVKVNFIAKTLNDLKGNAVIQLKKRWKIGWKISWEDSWRIRRIKEKIYYYIVNTYWNYADYKIIETIGKTCKPLFVKFENSITKPRVFDPFDPFKKIVVTVEQKILHDFFLDLNHLSPKTKILNSFSQYVANDNNASLLSRIIVAIYFLNELLGRSKCKNVLMSSGGSPLINLVSKISSKYNIPNYLMTIHPYEEYIPLSKVLLTGKKILVSGMRLKNELKTLGFDEDRMIVTGNPKFDSTNKKMLSKKNKNQEQNFSKNKVVLVANSRWNEFDDKWLPDLITYCNKNGFEVIIKVHPMYKFWNTDRHKMMVNKIKKQCKTSNYKILIDVEFEQLLLNVDLLITEFSWTGFEGSLFNLPIIVMNFNKTKYSKFALQYHKEGIALYAETINDLKNCIHKIMSDKSTQIKLQKARDKMNYEFNYLNDGKAANRIYEILTSDSLTRN